MLLRMVEEEGGVAVERNNSNNKQTPYISPKETLNPTIEWCQANVTFYLIDT